MGWGRRAHPPAAGGDRGRSLRAPRAEGPRAGDRVVLATRNPGKLIEFGRLLAPTGWALVGLDHLAGGPRVAWEEDGPDYASNALIKALSVASALGGFALGDDSGFEITALGGWPGIASARWLGPGASDEDRLTALMDRLSGLRPGRRGAAFVCALALAAPADGGTATVVAEATGRVDGRFTRDRRGAGGFGYDPIFIPRGFSRTTGEMAPAAKDWVSHRGAATRELLRLLEPAPELTKGRVRRRGGGGPPPDQGG